LRADAKSRFGAPALRVSIATINQGGHNEKDKMVSIVLGLGVDIGLGIPQNI